MNARHDQDDAPLRWWGRKKKTHKIDIGKHQRLGGTKEGWESAATKAAPPRREKIAPCFLNFFSGSLGTKTERSVCPQRIFFPAQEKRGYFTAVKYFKGAHI